MIAAINILANRRNGAFANELMGHLYGQLSGKNKAFLELISGLAFPGSDFFGFFQHEKIYHDFDLFIEKVSGYHGVDFIYLAVDKEVSKERIEEVRNNKKEFDNFFEELSLQCHLWKGKKEAVDALVYDTADYKEGLIGLAKEIYYNDEFGRVVDSLANTYKQSSEDIQRRLLEKSPLDLAFEIKGKVFSCRQSFARYCFIPSFFLRDGNIASWDETTFIFFYGVKAGRIVDHEETEKVLSIFKSLSDKTRLQILQYLKDKPAYGKQLAEELKLSTATISRHLDQLRSMNLIIEEKSNNFKYFRLNPQEIDRLLEVIEKFLSAK